MILWQMYTWISENPFASIKKPVTITESKWFEVHIGWVTCFCVKERIHNLFKLHLIMPHFSTMSHYRERSVCIIHNSCLVENIWKPHFLSLKKIYHQLLVYSWYKQDLNDQLKLASAEFFLVKFLTSLNEFLVQMRQLFCRRGAADPR